MAGMNEEGRQWYVVNTYAGHENKVKENLTKRIESMNLGDYLFNIVVPEIEKEVIVNGQRKIEKENLYPGYVFVDMVMTDEAWYVVRNTSGVTGFIGSSGGGAKPFPVIKEEIEPILKKLGVKSKIVSVDYEVGDEVEVVDGNFVGYTGIVDTINMEEQQAVIYVTFMNKKTQVTLDLDAIKKVEM